MSNARISKLLEPGKIGTVWTKNRIVKVAATHAWYPYEDGYFPEEAKAFYEALAKGGAGLIVVSVANIDYPYGLFPDRGWRIDDDKFIPGLKDVVDRIHKYGCPALQQLFHIGPIYPGSFFGHEVLAASTLTKENHPQPHWEPCRGLRKEEVKRLVVKFAEAAERTRKAGFDGIELNAGSHHMFNSFLSPAWNFREDEYGGSTENRARFLTEIIREVKQRNGRDFVVTVLFAGAEIGLKNGMILDEGKKIAEILESVGADAIQVRPEYYTEAARSGATESTHFPEAAFYPEIAEEKNQLVDTSRHGAGAWVPVAAAIKKHVAVPVIAVGRLDPVIGEAALRKGDADFIGLNRRLLADPELPNKVAQNRLEDIAPCTACLTCFHQIESFIPMKPPLCRINTMLGREKTYQIVPAEKKKKVMIVGGGPAGMEAARVSALRGHDVSLYEKSARLGGAMNVAGIVKGYEREDLEALTRYLETQIVKLGVQIIRSKEVGRALIEKVKPDVLVLATGGAHDFPHIPGMDRSSFLTGKVLHDKLKFFLKFFKPKTLHRLTNIWMPVGSRVAIIGGNIQGCQTAEFLVKRGRKVTIVEESDKIGEGLLGMLLKPRLLWWLQKNGVATLTQVKCKKIDDDGLSVTEEDSNLRTIAANTVISALPLKTNKDLIKDLEGTVPEIYAIGDCESPQLIVDAIHAGSKVGRAI